MIGSNKARDKDSPNPAVSWEYQENFTEHWSGGFPIKPRSISFSSAYFHNRKATNLFFFQMQNRNKCNSFLVSLLLASADLVSKAKAVSYLPVPRRHAG